MGVPSCEMTVLIVFFSLSWTRFCLQVASRNSIEPVIRKNFSDLANLPHMPVQKSLAHPAFTIRCSCNTHSDVFTSLALLLASSPRSPADGHQGRGRRPGSRRPNRQAA